MFEVVTFVIGVGVLEEVVIPVASAGWTYLQSLV
jgi:hypothetical protein